MKKEIKKKKVRFSNIVTVYEVEDSEEHRSARNGLQDLRDRHRFKKRIKNVEIILNPILKMKITSYFFTILPFSV